MTTIKFPDSEKFQQLCAKFFSESNLYLESRKHFEEKKIPFTEKQTEFKKFLETLLNKASNLCAGKQLKGIYLVVHELNNYYSVKIMGNPEYVVEGRKLFKQRKRVFMEFQSILIKISEQK